MSICSNLKNIQSELPDHVRLVAVSKTKPIEAILEAYGCGQRDFGENKIQDLVEKYHELPKDITWHMIGHVQRNKIKYIAPFIDLIHGVESFKVLKEINKQALKHQRIIDCLLQIKIASEDSKFGMTASEAIKILTSQEINDLKNIHIVGLMGMASFTEDQDQIRTEFQQLRSTFKALCKDISFSK